MFYSLTGEVVAVDPAFLAVSCGGVAYKCFTSLTTLQKLGGLGDTVTVYTYLSVTENAVELYGFADLQELEFFKMLIGVSGVGPKAAVSVLSQFSCDALSLCIASGDVKSITRAQGVGAKIGQRIILELKDKMTKLAPSSMQASDLRSPAPAAFGGNIPEAVTALTALGFSGADAQRALSSANPADPVETLVKLGLRMLAGG